MRRVLCAPLSPMCPSSTLFPSSAVRLIGCQSSIYFPPVTSLARTASLSGKEPFMEAVSDDDVALVYIRLVRKESPAAATILEQIHQQFGARTALNSALVVTLLKQEIQHDHSL